MGSRRNVSEENLTPSALRWRRFFSNRLAARSLRALMAFYAICLCSELICNDKPLVLHHGGRTFFPAFRQYTQDQVLGNGSHARMLDYQHEAAFTNSRSWALYPIVRHGPNTTMREEDYRDFRRVTIRVVPDNPSLRLDVVRAEDGSRYRVVRSEGDAGAFFYRDAASSNAWLLDDEWTLPHDILDAIDSRLKDPAAAFPGISMLCENAHGGSSGEGRGKVAQVSIPPRSASAADENCASLPARVVMRRPESSPPVTITAARDGIGKRLAGVGALTDGARAKIAELAGRSFDEFVPQFEVPYGEVTASVAIIDEPVTWPYRPVPGNWCGTDMSGRDVLARLVYGGRVALTFGILLVIASMALGIVAGAIQGYFAGWTDLVGQRLTEVWSALPFLYVMILLGNMLGRGFGLFLLCYAAFNWIGIAAYTRAEFLRLRTRAFVDAARAQGLGSWRIMARHILPSAVTPIITLAPFQFVGAVGSLAALDYLGFGLPDVIPSWGTMLFQAQLARHAWWLILYPSLLLFAVMILGVFVGEGLRSAFDPRSD